MSDSVWPHRRQPTRVPRPWDSPSKNTGVGCHFLIQCMKVKSESEVAQLCPTVSDPMDCSLPGSSDHGIFQARVLEWVAIAFSAIQVWVSPNPHQHLVLHFFFSNLMAVKWYLIINFCISLPTFLNQFIRLLKSSFLFTCLFISFAHLKHKIAVFVS